MVTNLSCVRSRELVRELRREAGWCGKIDRDDLAIALEPLGDAWLADQLYQAARCMPYSTGWDWLDQILLSLSLVCDALEPAAL